MLPASEMVVMMMLLLVLLISRFRFVARGTNEEEGFCQTIQKSQNVLSVAV